MADMSTRLKQMSGTVPGTTAEEDPKDAFMAELRDKLTEAGIDYHIADDGALVVGRAAPPDHDDVPTDEENRAAMDRAVESGAWTGGWTESNDINAPSGPSNRPLPNRRAFRL